MKALDALKFDLQVKAELNEPTVQKNFKEGNSKVVVLKGLKRDSNLSENS